MGFGDEDEVLPEEKTNHFATILGYKFTLKELCLYSALVVLSIVCFALIIALATHKGSGSSEAGGGGTETQTDCRTQPCLQAASLMLQNMNSSMDPCEDFHQYACGNFPASNPIMPEYASTGTVINMRQKVEGEIFRALEDPISRYETDSWERKIKQLFQSCTNDLMAESWKGIPLLQNIKIVGWNVLQSSAEYNITDWRDFRASLRTAHVEFLSRALFQVFVVPKPDDSADRVIEIRHAGLGMPLALYFGQENVLVESYYNRFKGSVASLLVRDAGLELDEEMQGLISSFVEDSYAFEKQLAELTKTFSATEESMLTTVTNISASMPQFDWHLLLGELFGEAGITGDTPVYIKHYGYISTLNSLLEVTLNGPDGDRILNNYLIWTLAQQYVGKLSWEYRESDNAFELALTGHSDPTPRWRECVWEAERYMPQAVSALYVDIHNVDNDVDAVTDMAFYIRRALIAKTEQLEWMDLATKNKALDKIEKITETIGYEDAYENDTRIDTIYKELEITQHSMFQNVLNWNVYEKHKMNAMLKKSIDDTIYWLEGAHRSQVFLTEILNQFTAPAASMQEPVFVREAPMAVNFGALGSEIARQHSHVIDEKGSHNMADGSYQNWWSNDTMQQYNTNKDCFADVIGDIKFGPYDVNGLLTYTAGGYDVADWIIPEVGALKDAWQGYLLWNDDKEAKKATLPGISLNDVQSFFVSYAQTNCFNRRDRWTWNLLHQGYIPENIRINEALKQLPAFHEAFQCGTGSTMVATKQCQLL